MGMVAHVPAVVWTDVASGVGNEGAAVPAPAAALGVSPAEQLARVPAHNPTAPKVTPVLNRRR